MRYYKPQAIALTRASNPKFSCTLSISPERKPNLFPTWRCCQPSALKTHRDSTLPPYLQMTLLTPSPNPSLPPADLLPCCLPVSPAASSGCQPPPDRWPHTATRHNPSRTPDQPHQHALKPPHTKHTPPRSEHSPPRSPAADQLVLAWLLQQAGEWTRPPGAARTTAAHQTPAQTKTHQNLAMLSLHA